MLVDNTPVLAMILKGYPRISETFISNEIKLLEKNGVKIHIISMREPRESFTHKSISEIKAKVSYLPSTLEDCLDKIFKVNAVDEISTSAIFTDDKELQSRLTPAIEDFFKTGNESTFKHILQAEYVNKFILPGSNIFHIHAHFAHSPTSVARNISEISKLPFSFTAHAKDIYTQEKEKITTKISQAKFAVTCTGYNCEYLQEIAPEGKPIHKVYHGIDLKLFNSNKKPKTVSSPFEIFTVARFTEKKGLPTVFKALKILSEQGIDFKYKIVGDGDDRKENIKLFKEFGIEDKCEWLGTKTHEEVLDLYRNADAFVLGCHIAKNGDRDGIPNVLAESMAMKVPVICTNVSGIPELIENGKEGFLVNPHDPQAMAEKLNLILTDIELRKKVIPAAYEKVNKVFDNLYWINKLIEVYAKYDLKA